MPKFEDLIVTAGFNKEALKAYVEQQNTVAQILSVLNKNKSVSDPLTGEAFKEAFSNLETSIKSLLPQQSVAETISALEAQLDAISDIQLDALNSIKEEIRNTIQALEATESDTNPLSEQVESPSKQPDEHLQVSQEHSATNTEDVVKAIADLNAQMWSVNKANNTIQALEATESDTNPLLEQVESPSKQPDEHLQVSQEHSATNTEDVVKAIADLNAQMWSVNKANNTIQALEATESDTNPLLEQVESPSKQPDEHLQVSQEHSATNTEDVVKAIADLNAQMWSVNKANNTIQALEATESDTNPLLEQVESPSKQPDEHLQVSQEHSATNTEDVVKAIADLNAQMWSVNKANNTIQALEATESDTNPLSEQVESPSKQPDEHLQVSQEHSATNTEDVVKAIADLNAQMWSVNKANNTDYQPIPQLSNWDIPITKPQVAANNIKILCAALTAEGVLSQNQFDLDALLSSPTIVSLREQDKEFDKQVPSVSRTPIPKKQDSEKQPSKYAQELRTLAGTPFVPISATAEVFGIDKEYARIKGNREITKEFKEKEKGFKEEYDQEQDTVRAELSTAKKEEKEAARAVKYAKKEAKAHPSDGSYTDYLVQAEKDKQEKTAARKELQDKEKENKARYEEERASRKDIADIKKAQNTALKKLLLPVAGSAIAALFTKDGRQAWAALGETLMDLFKEVKPLAVQFFNDVITPAWDKFKDWISDVWENKIVPVAKPLLSKFKDWFSDVWENKIVPVAKPLLSKLGDTIENSIRKALGLKFTDKTEDGTELRYSKKGKEALQAERLSSNLDNNLSALEVLRENRDLISVGGKLSIPAHGRNYAYGYAPRDTYKVKDGFVVATSSNLFDVGKTLRNMLLRNFKSSPEITPDDTEDERKEKILNSFYTEAASKFSVEGELLDDMAKFDNIADAHKFLADQMLKVTYTKDGNLITFKYISSAKDISNEAIYQQDVANFQQKSTVKPTGIFSNKEKIIANTVSPTHYSSDTQPSVIQTSEKTSVSLPTVEFTPLEEGGSVDSVDATHYTYKGGIEGLEDNNTGKAKSDWIPTGDDGDPGNLQVAPKLVSAIQDLKKRSGKRVHVTAGNDWYHWNKYYTGGYKGSATSRHSKYLAVDLMFDSGLYSWLFKGKDSCTPTAVGNSWFRDWDINPFRAWNETNNGTGGHFHIEFGYNAAFSLDKTAMTDFSKIDPEKEDSADIDSKEAQYITEVKAELSSDPSGSDTGITVNYPDYLNPNISFLTATQLKAFSGGDLSSSGTIGNSLNKTGTSVSNIHTAQPLIVKEVEQAAPQAGGAQIINDNKQSVSQTNNTYVVKNDPLNKNE